MSTAPVLVALVPPEEVGSTSAVLFAAGAGAIGERASGAFVELEAGFVDREAAERALALLPPGIEGRVVEVDADGWVTAQRRAITGRRIGAFDVRPPWDLPAPTLDATGLVIDPGAAFGHGGHPSTSLLLELLDSIVAPGCRVVDVGTGSGVLAVAAARLGAQVWAVDVDAVAVRVARANVSHNRVDDRVEVEQVDAANRSLGSADVALVNMTLDGHRRIARRLDAIDLVAASGILDEQVATTRHVYRPRRVRRVESTAGWSALVLDRAEP